jgi:hypothetical protein
VVGISVTVVVGVIVVVLNEVVMIGFGRLVVVVVGAIVVVDVMIGTIGVVTTSKQRQTGQSIKWCSSLSQPFNLHGISQSELLVGRYTKQFSISSQVGLLIGLG